MTPQEYKQYKRAVARFFETEHIHFESINTEKEAWFSWRACECCGSPLGGDRYQLRAVNKDDNEIVEYAVCVDCMYYITYGQLDDTTMLEIEKQL